MNLEIHFKALIRDFITHVFYKSKLTSARLNNRNFLTIITFHRILPKKQKAKYPFPGLVVTPEEFEWIMKYCRSNYTCGSLDEMNEQWEQTVNPQKPFLAITFDDGQEDNFQYAAPILDKLELKATFFVPVAHIESGDFLWHDIVGFYTLEFAGENNEDFQQFLSIFGMQIDTSLSPMETTKIVIAKLKSFDDETRNAFVEKIQQKFKLREEYSWAGMMSWKQLEVLNSNGHEIGSHSLTHPILPKCGEKEMEQEIIKSGNIIENKLQSKVVSFCYPNGDFSEEVLRFTKEANYNQAVTTKWMTNHKGKRKLTLGRCDIDPMRLKDRTGKLQTSKLEYRLSKIRRMLE